jgi:hypothetical protein
MQIALPDIPRHISIAKYLQRVESFFSFSCNHLVRQRGTKEKRKEKVNGKKNIKHGEDRSMSRKAVL